MTAAAFTDPPEVAAFVARVESRVVEAICMRTEREILGLPPSESDERLLAAYSRASGGKDDETDGEDD